MGKIKFLTIFLLNILLSSSTLLGSVESKQVEKRFAANKEINLSVNSRYGKLQFKSWNKDSVYFRIHMEVKGKNAEKTASLLEDIQVEFTEGRHFINAETTFGDSFALKKLSNSLFNSGKISIHYVIWAPSYLPMNIVLKNGSMLIDKHDGNITVDQSDGDFTAHALQGTNRFTFRNVEIKLDSLDSAELDMSNCELYIKSGEKITAESRNSEITVESVNIFNLKSSRDKIDISNVEFLYGVSSMSKFEIDDLGSELDYELTLGYMNIFNIHNMFSFVKLDSKFGNLGLNFMPNSNYHVEIKHKAVKLRYPHAFDLKQESTGERNSYLTTGLVGKEQTPSLVKVRANNCRISLN